MTGRWWRGRGPVVAVVGVCLAAYVGSDLARFLTFHSAAYDLGFFDQLTSNLSTGHGWASSFISYDFRGQHWEPILLVWAQLYRLVQSPIWLLVVSGAALALAPLAAWRLALRWLGPDHRGAALVFAVATALSPLVLRTAGFDYHSEALTPLLALVALEAASRRRWIVLVAACAVLALLKEDAFLVIAGIGWLVWRVEHRRWGLLLSLAALVGFVIIVGVYMPGFRGGRNGDLLTRYAYLAAPGRSGGAFAIVAGMVAHPGNWISHLFSGPPLRGLAVALLPLAVLPPLAGVSFVAVLPALGVALLSADPLQASLQLHYGAEVFPLLLACAMLGWRRVQERVRGARAGRFRRALAVGAVTAIVLVVPLTVNLGARIDDLGGAGRRGAVQSVLDMVPHDAAVAASTDLVAHLSDRPAVTEFPDVRGARWVVLDSLGRASQYSVAAGYRAAVAHLPLAFHAVASGGGVVLWERS